MALDAEPTVEGATEVLHTLYSNAYVKVNDANEAVWNAVLDGCPEHLDVVDEAIRIATFGAGTLAAYVMPPSTTDAGNGRTDER